MQANELDKQIVEAQQALNNLLAQRDALKAMDGWTSTTTLNELTHVLTVLKLSGVTPVAVVYIDGSVNIMRADYVTQRDVIKGVSAPTK